MLAFYARFTEIELQKELCASIEEDVPCAQMGRLQVAFFWGAYISQGDVFCSRSACPEVGGISSFEGLGG